MKRLLFRLFFLGIISTMTYATLAADGVQPHVSPQFADGKFRNPVKMKEHSVAETMKMMWTFATGKRADTIPTGSIPVQVLTRAQLMAAPDNTLFRLGHSTLLLKIHNEFFLTDPVFSERASPVQWAGPARFHHSPISIDELPPIKAVILSHDHYDHLDHDAILKLDGKTERFLTPLGVGDRLIKWGVGAAKVEQLDWWEATDVRGVTFIATPAQHFSGRSLSDKNSTLWASWVIQYQGLRIFFSGDTGYFDGFKAIGEKYGPFDVTMIETGAYDQQWPDVHMQPEETLQAFIDLKGKWLMPVHNGTFDLGLHAWREPFDRIAALAEAGKVPLTTPEMGQALNLKQPEAFMQWWKQVD
jgi:L-ascorbate metabolism protein UlaG (beta-lactamase superfamily)